MRRTLPDSGLHDPTAVRDSGHDPYRAGLLHGRWRRSLLHDDPDIDVVDMATLVQIAKAIEDESAKRYAMLAELMSRRGEPATAAAFRAMRDEERRHVVAVDRWAESVGDPAPKANVEWRLPPDLSSSWDEVAGSALLTPYLAFAVAVDNEVRAFSFYAYLAAHAENEQIRAEAEKLGGEELRHAALLRRWRRRAYHRERRTVQPEPLRIESTAELRAFLAQQEAAIAATHRAVAKRLERAGDKASAQLLERSIPGSTQPVATAALGMETAELELAADANEDPRHLLLVAQKPLELLADALESVMAKAEGELFDEAAAALGDVVQRIARISLQVG